MPPKTKDAPVDSETAAPGSLYHFPDANGLASVPVVAAADESGTYTLGRDGIIIATGVPASTEPLAGHVIL